MRRRQGRLRLDRGAVPPPVILEAARLELGEEMNALAEQTIVRRGGEPHRGVIGIFEAGRLLDLRHEAIRLAPRSAELPPLEEDQVPGDE